MEHLKLKVAVYLMLIRDEKILLSRRFNTGWHDGDYGLPAGHLEANETIAQGLFREVMEEVGTTLDPKDISLVHTMHRSSNYIDFFFRSERWNGDPAIMEKDKCDDIKWFPLDQLPENIVPSVRSAITLSQKGILFSEFDSSED